MLVPEIVWSMSEKLHGQNVAASEDQEAGRGGAEIDNRPKSALHRFAPSLFGSDSVARKNDASGNGNEEESCR
jgi:hypothetical protein